MEQQQKARPTLFKPLEKLPEDIQRFLVESFLRNEGSPDRLNYLSILRPRTPLGLTVPLSLLARAEEVIE
jgi:hypothetical protein